MQAALSRRIPPGTSIDAARRVMQSEGFTCDLKRNETLELEEGMQDGKHLGRLDYLQCRRVQSAGWPLTHRWTVALVLDGDSVSEVLVYHIVHGT